MTSEPDDPSRPIRKGDDLCGVFRASEKPASAFRIGVEAEKFAVHERTGEPLSFDGARSVSRIFAELERFGWRAERETEAGPVIALRRAAASITLEPGSQLELSGSPLDDLHAARAELDEHLRELAPVSRELELAWLSVGFHPIARQVELGWVPKQRYQVMKVYLPTRGSAAHDMMRRTATVQANFDYANEEDAMRKLTVGLRLSPVLNALTAHAPFCERKKSDHKSLRGEVWLRMDPARSGLIPKLWTKKPPRYADYAEWALDAGMFLFKRGGRVFANTGQTFRDFIEHGFHGERATVADWRLHLNTLFPEARLKNTIELRAMDAQKDELTMAVPALFTGLFYDETSLAEAERIALELDYDTVQAARPLLVRDGLAAKIGGVPVRRLAERLFELAQGGLDRRARLDAAGNDETKYLTPLGALLARGECPADVTAGGVATGAELGVAELIARTRIELGQGGWN